MTGWLDFFQGWLADLRGRHLARRSVEQAECWGFRWMEFCRELGAERPAEVGRAEVAAWVRVLRSRRYAASTLDVALRTVRAWMRWGVRRGLLLVDPTRGMRLRRPPRSSRPWLTPEEMQTLLSLPHPGTPQGLRDRAVLETLYSAGLRGGECCALDLEDLDLAGGLLRVRRGKGGKDRLLPLGRVHARALVDYLTAARPRLVQDPGERALFLTRFGTRLGLQTIQVRLRGYVKQAGFTGRLPTPHSLRHSCGTHLLQNGADLLQIQVFLGHSHVSTTETYTHLLPVDLVEEHRRCHPRARRKGD
ncbi:MAG: tyrosine-type recombinase/integrase [Candidatus Eremiobacterota bacterium]